MAGSMCNRMMRLLRTTSIHHSPSRLATAVAVGVLAGLLPKDNLLAIAVYVAMIFMPLHTPLSFLTSVAVSFASHQLDSVCHSIGHSVHQLTVLRPVWMALDSAPLAPWMSLHNSVVLGALIVGLAAAGPLYLVTVRVFEFLVYRADNSKLPTRKKPRRSAEPVTAMPVATSVAVAPTSSAIIPPPKFIKQPARQSDPVLSRVADSDEVIESQPTAQPEPLINAWHMGYGAAKQNQLQTVSVGVSEPPRKLAMDEPKAPRLPSPPPLSSAESNFHSTENHSYEAMTSLSIASHADEVLTWVDQVLEECLSEDSLTVMASDAPEVTHMLECNTATLEQDVACDPVEVPGNDQWLMETTIEIVRWADESIPIEIASSSATSAAMIQPKSSNKSMLTVVPNSSLSGEASKGVSVIAATETAIDQSKMNAQIATPASGPTVTPSVDSDDVDNRPRVLNFAQRRDQNNRGPVTGFEHVVLAQSTTETVTGSDSGSPKAECLGYILEHLRQTREGKST